MCLEKREPNLSSLESIWKTRKMAFTFALDVETNFLVQAQNLIQLQAGPVSGQVPRITSKKKRITVSECIELR